MAVYSMTGFAATQQSIGDQEYEIGAEIRTVNSRFLDIHYKMPDAFRQHEGALRKLLGEHIKRSKVELRIFIVQEQALHVTPPTAQTLTQLAAVQEQIKAWLPGAKDLSVADVLRLGSVPNDGQGNILWEVLQALIAKALKDLLAARRKEGTRLAKLLLDNIGQLRDLAAKAKPLVPQLVEQQRERFLARWNEALGIGNTADVHATESMQERALAEATAYAIRIDVAEELGRLSAHLDEIEALLDKGGELGKRLDFMIQELHREANTLGSKSTSLELSRISMDMKVLIEQMREQVQNIE